jgi:hypothetical protein
MRISATAFSVACPRRRRWNGERVSGEFLRFADVSCSLHIVTPGQLPSREAAEEWVACVRVARMDFEQKLSLEREAAAAEQRIAAATADIVHNQKRENFAVQEAEGSAAELRDVMSSVEAIQAQLPQLEKMSHECALLERRLALELQMLQLDAANADEEAQSSGSAAPPVAPQSSAALSHLPHDLVARVNAVLDKV